jgi:Secretion system C-terminal sorting domain
MKKTFLIPILLLLWYNSWAQCPATVTISGVYTTTYTGSNSWIATSGVTTIPTGADVTLDANPLTNGYVLLDTGFETLPNATFLAVVVTPCSLLGTSQNSLQNSLTIFPNPTNNLININANNMILQTEIYDVNGRLIANSSHNSENVILDVSSLSNGIYMLKIATENGVSTQKVVKN